MKPYLVVVCGLLYFVFPALIFAQGSLTPPGAPAASMKTLAQIEPRTPIISLPAIISSPGAYYLTTNLTGTSGQFGVIIASGNVTLDLNQFSLIGVPGSQSGVFVNASLTNIVIRNGVITRWGNQGVDTYSAAFPRNVLLENLALSANGGNGVLAEAGTVIRNCLAMKNDDDGFNSVGGQVFQCISRENGNDGFELVDTDVAYCRAEYNGNCGFNLNRVRVLNCSSQYNVFGYLCASLGNDVRDSVALGNSSGGFQITGAACVSSSLISSNNSYGVNIFPSSTGSQIIGNQVLGHTNLSIMVQGSRNRIDNNNVLATPGTVGIQINSASASNNIVTRNCVIGAGVNNYIIIGPNNDVGPIGGASTNNSPWLNISR